MSHSHQPGRDKQTNKAHKTKHAGKGTVKARAQGKVEKQRVSVKSRPEKKWDRVNHNKQRASNKRQELVARKRSEKDCPRVLALIPLSAAANTKALAAQLTEESAHSHADPNHTLVLSVGQADKHQMSIVVPSSDTYSVLDATKVADVTVLVIPLSGVDEHGEELLSAIKAQGTTSILCVIQMDDSNPRMKNEYKKNIIRFMHTEFPDQPRVVPVEKSADVKNLLRFVKDLKLKSLQWRDRSSYVLAEKLEFQPYPQDAAHGTMKVTGFVRGSFGMSVNQLVHVPGVGDFQLDQIDVAESAMSKILRPRGGMDVDDGQRMVAKADPNERESLQAVNDVDPLANEQTWPTEEELKEAEEAEKKRKKLRKKPKGWSDYQTAWIPAVDEDGEYEIQEGNDDQMEADDEKMKSDTESESEEEEEYEEVGGSDDEMDEVDESITDEQREQQRLEFFEALQRKQMEDAEFPDEMDTPLDKPARQRFAKFRGLNSIRDSEWDPKESLPLDYARIFEFENFEVTKKWVQRQAEENSVVEPGTYVTLHLAQFPAAAARPEVYRMGERPFLLCGLLKYQNKQTVINCTIQKFAGYEAPVKSKTSVEVHCGFRRYLAQPIYSENTSRIDKHKFERFLQPGRFTVATLYGPADYPPAPVLFFTGRGTPLPSSRPTLVATGSLTDVNPNRICLKKIVLSGYPFRVHKRHSVIRYMFFNEKDIRWFKPVKLWTKLGRSGEIKCPVGTHGYMKCTFDSQLKQNDTVCMSLYKRVYPRSVPLDALYNLQ